MKNLYKLSILIPILWAPIARQAEVGIVRSLENAKIVPYYQDGQQKSLVLLETLASNAKIPPIINVIACLGSNNKPGILCSDGFCDTSPPNQCNGHGGISPGHFVSRSNLGGI